MRLRSPDWKWLIHIVLIYSGAVVFGFVGTWINLPLPWMIGAIFFAAALRLSDLPVRVPAFTRPLGQVGVAAMVGLSFTPEAVAAMASLLLPMAVSALLTVLAGFAVAVVLMRMAHIDVVTASLASVPLGPVESAVLADRHGVDPGPVVFSQTLRIMALVVLVPPIIVALQGGIADPQAALRAIPWTPGGAGLLAVLAAIGAFLARTLRIANPYFLGALGGASLGAAFSLPVSGFPYPVLIAAQIFLGVWLGAVFDRALLRRAGRFIPAAVLCAVLMILLCAALGLGLSLVTGVNWPVMVLATAPGSITEMALTAKVLQEGIAIVTAFHITRVFIILPSAPLIFSITARLAARYGAGPDSAARPPDGGSKR
jgi:uncharacterized protein